MDDYSLDTDWPWSLSRNPLYRLKDTTFLPCLKPKNMDVLRSWFSLVPFISYIA